MIPFRGKVHFKVYNPDKPDKYGVKSYQLCDSSNGYCCKFEIYTGGNQDPPSAKGETYDPVLQRVFRRELVKELVCSSGISPSSTPRGYPRRSVECLTRLQAGSHFPEKIEGTGRKTNITRSCIVCFPAQKMILARVGEKRKRPGRESTCSFQCSVCKVALCIQECFQLYHTVQDYVAAYVRRHDTNNDDTVD